MGKGMRWSDSLWCWRKPDQRRETVMVANGRDTSTRYGTDRQTT